MMKLGGKNISKFWSIVAVLLLISGTVYYIFIKGALPSSDEAKALLFICGGIILFNSPYYISIWLDKFTKNGGEE